MSFFITPAFAADSNSTSGGFELFIMMAVFAVIFYFMIFRPQSKRVKEQKRLMSSLSKGDEVLTSGGLIGLITKVSDESEYLRISLNGDIVITIKKDFISAVLPKGTLKSL